jgi:hypothetical protein
VGSSSALSFLSFEATACKRRQIESVAKRIAVDFVSIFINLCISSSYGKWEHIFSEKNKNLYIHNNRKIKK